MNVQLSFEGAEAPVDAEEARSALQSVAFARVQRTGKALLDCPLEDPVAVADLRTSLADARAALTIAAGVPVDEVNPATGNEHSARIYAAHRKGWQRSYDRTVAGHLGWDLDELQLVAETARQEFVARRPDLDDGRPWITPRARTGGASA